MFLLLTMLVYFSPANLILGQNCLQANPDILDVDFNFDDEHQADLSATESGVEKAVELFSTRFKRVHQIGPITRDSLNVLAEGVSKYTNSSNKTVQVYLSTSTPLIRKDRNGAIHEYQADFELIKKLNSANADTVVGLYLSILDTQLDVHDEHDATEFVFGTKENSTFPIGDSFKRCLHWFKDPRISRYLHRLNFISCTIDPKVKPSPEESADEVVRQCDEVRDFAKSVNITAEIMCSVGFNSYVQKKAYVGGSVLEFKKFWCRIVDVVSRDKSHPQIILRSAFDTPPAHYTSGGRTHYYEQEQSGWWRRRVASSNEAGAFLEKVEELEGGREDRGCTKICGACSLSDECCDSKICATDSSFQPFEIGRESKACQSNITVCAPRRPVASPAPQTTTQILNVPIASGVASDSPTVHYSTTGSSSTPEYSTGSSTFPARNIAILCATTNAFCLYSHQ